MERPSETIDGLLAEFRDLAKHRDWNNHTRQSNRERVSDLADRIEAVIAREREASGNAAAMREALKPVKRYLDGYTVNILELRRMVDAALAAPARNCDRFASAEKAWDAYDAWVESYGLKGKVPPYNEFGWLFALSAEKEGGAK